MDPTYLRYLLNSLKVSVSLPDIWPVLPSARASITHWFILLLLNVLCSQGENGDRGIKGEKGDAHGDFFVSGPPGLPGSPGLVVSSDFSSPFSSVSHSLP